MPACAARWRRRAQSASLFRFVRARVELPGCFEFAFAVDPTRDALAAYNAGRCGSRANARVVSVHDNKATRQQSNEDLA
ncbi:hypothetical protein C0Z16_00480 [Paraburkholderia rhynchosiae]|uniref:Uncharacterized protein n=1 Tax=Paraburkholderia rhynchosiae TaxID=487049 RepID=A0ABX4VCX1_9BURK|nr:hypothetical protein C0Z16_00480 [Paraburkholderia rhynchosiae]